MCFVTMHQFFELFNCALRFIKNTLKYYRLTLPQKPLAEESHAAQMQADLEASTKVPFMTDHGKNMLSELFSQNVEYNKEIIIQCLPEIYNAFSYKVPYYTELHKPFMNYFFLYSFTY